MSDFVFVCEDEAAKHEGVELPAEGDGSLLLSVVQSQFEGASGLKYRNPNTGLWRAVKILEGILHPPEGGWGDTPYIVVRRPESTPSVPVAVAPVTVTPIPVSSNSETDTTADGYKRKMTQEDEEGERAAKNPRSSSPDFSNLEVQDLNREDLIILGLEYSVNDAELKRYFEQFGEVAAAEVKRDIDTGKSRGFGFVRYFDPEIQRKVQGMKHVLKGRRVDIKHPKKSSSYLPSKIFVGCLPLKPEVTKEELEEYFSQYGDLCDVYIPKPYRGFGFITFEDGNVARSVMSMTHSLRRSTLNLTVAEPKGTRSQQFQYGASPYDPYHQHWYAPQVGYGAQSLPFPYNTPQSMAAFAAAYSRGFNPRQSTSTYTSSSGPPPPEPQQQSYRQDYPASPQNQQAPPPPPASNTASRGQQYSTQGSQYYNRSPQYPSDSGTQQYGTEGYSAYGGAGRYVPGSAKQLPQQQQPQQQQQPPQQQPQYQQDAKMWQNY